LCHLSPPPRVLHYFPTRRSSDLATGDTMVYRDGGATGEEVTRRVIEGVPTHLLPGGSCVILCVSRDTEEQTFEQRAGDWLGTARSEEHTSELQSLTNLVCRLLLP